MSTALVKYERDTFLTLQSGNQFAESLAALREAGEQLQPSDLIRIKTPSGGATSWMVPASGGGEKPEKELVGALVGWQKCAVLWPTNDMQEGNQPVLRSWDCQTAEQVGEIPAEMVDVLEPYRTGERTFNIDELDGFPYMQWGTGKDGHGKRMKEQRMIFLLRPNDPAPMYVIVQPGSLKGINQWFKQIPLVDKVPWWQVVARLSLRKETSKGGQAYAQIIGETAGLLEPDVAKDLRSTWGDMLAKLARKIDLEPAE